MIIPTPVKYTYNGRKRKLSKHEISFVKNDKFLEETYEIEITENSATVTAKGEKGFFYAEKTLEFMTDESGFVPLSRVYDFPRFSYRAFMVDSSRHMQSVDELKAFIEAASKLKFNFFHWHLSDDQGYRIESEVFPKLNSVGSWRKNEGFGKGGSEPYGGYYTKAQVKEIVDFCKQRHIEVIPEIDLPGHTTSLLASYPNLTCGGREIEVKNVHGIFKDILCAGKEETYDFCFKLLEEVIELFPCEYFHIGGDEAPKARWKVCPDCQAAIKRENLENEEQLQGHFTKRICEFLKAHGKKPICWNESLKSGMIENDTVICDWLDPRHDSEKFANGGGKIIIEDFSHYYLDYPYGRTSVKKTYGFEPLLKRLGGVGRENVLGVEAPIWTEFADNFQRLSYLCFPRLAAVAESGWSKPENKNYSDFERRAVSFGKTLLKLGIEQADVSAWNPVGLSKARDFSRVYYRKLTPTVIRWLLKPEEYILED